MGQCSAVELVEAKRMAGHQRGATCVGLHFLRFRKASAFDVCTALRDPKNSRHVLCMKSQ